MRDVEVAGLAMTRFGKQMDRSLKDLAGEVVGGALVDAGLTTDELDAAYVANALGGAITAQEMVAGQVVLRPAGIEGIPVFNVENACASASTALHLGWQAVNSGAHDVVLCVGVEKMSHPDKGLSLAAIGRAADVEEVFGPEGPQPGSRSYFMDVYAGLARESLESGSATREDFAAVAVKNQHHGSLNPLAQYGQETTVEEVLAAREIVWPLTLPMCSPISDGAAAVVLVAGDRVRKTANPRVRIAASVVASGTRLPDSERKSSTVTASAKAYAAAAIGPDDLDHVEVHDAAAPAELSVYESIGLAAPGKGGELMRSGATKLGGRVPVNTSGGLLSKGHPIGATGLAQACEAVSQLRGHAGPRQVEGARWSLTQNGGGWIEGDNAAVAIHIFEGGVA
jgi:acetyl-CoA acyltransferase